MSSYKALGKRRRGKRNTSRSLDLLQEHARTGTHTVKQTDKASHTSTHSYADRHSERQSERDTHIQARVVVVPETKGNDEHTLSFRPSLNIHTSELIFVILPHRYNAGRKRRSWQRRLGYSWRQYVSLQQGSASRKREEQ